MEELSLHILDIVENSINAKATRVDIEVDINKEENLITIKVTDNGKGMDEKTLENVKDPFFTTKTTRKVGLGVSFLDEIAQLTGGSLDIESKLGIGTTIKLKLPIDHPDRPPLGDIVSTLITLLATNPCVWIVYRETRNGKSWEFNSKEVEELLGDYAWLGKIKEVLYNSYKEFTGGELI
ncbi:MAG: ATP-binding protein [bacterium]|nr:ATP-binding protein [bacterium]